MHGTRAGDVEVLTQASVRLQPVLIVGFKALQFAIAVREIAAGADKLLVIAEVVHLVVFGQGGPQFRAQLMIRRIPQSQNIRLQTA